MSAIFRNLLLLTFRMYIKDWIRFRYKLLLNIFNGLSVIIVSLIVDIDKLQNLTGINNPWIFLLSAFLLTSLVGATFHMPRAFAESDIQTGRFEYIMTTKSYKTNYFWYYTLVLLIIEIINMLPVVIIFAILVIVNSPVEITFEILPFIMNLLIFAFGFFLTLLISTVNLYSAIVSRRYQLNSSLVLIILSALSGSQFPYHVFSFPIRLIALLNPLTTAIELWRTVLLTDYTPFIEIGYLILFSLFHIFLLIFFSRHILRKMNEKIRINGAGKLLE